MSSLSIRLGLRVLLVAALYSCLLSVHSHAVTSNWNTDASGSFTTAANWDNGVPDSDDTAVLNRGIVAYTVTFPGNSFGSPPRQHVIDKLVVRTNEVTLADSLLFLQPPIVTFAATPSDSIVIGDTAGDLAILNTTLSSLSGANLTIGRASDATGTLNVDGTLSLSSGLVVADSGTGTLNVRSGMVSLGDYLRVANSGGVGALNITGGGRVATGGQVYAGGGGTATVNVTGAGSSLMSASDIFVAVSGIGALNVLAGGTVASEFGEIGYSGLGAVQVDGAGSMWTITQILTLGQFDTDSTGRLEITNGGKVSSAQGFVGNNPTTASTVTITGAGSAWTNSGNLVIGNLGGGELMITGGGNVASDYSLMANQVSANAVATITGAGSTWTNAGNLTVGSLGRATLNIIGGGSVSIAHASIGASAVPCIVSVDGTGSTWHSAGDLSIGHQGSGNSGTLIVSDSGVVSVDGLLFVEPTGIIAGNGMADASVINRGDVRPGLLASTSSGVLHVEGIYIQSQSGRLSVRLGGTMPAAQYDQLQVTGAVTLNGTLSVVLANSFQPSLGNVFNILDGSSIGGKFSTIQLPALAAGLSWSTSQLYTAGVLSVVSAGLPGDYNGNGVVDAADYTLWRDHLGQSFTLTNENSAAATPGVVDTEDYAFWKSHFGESPGSGSASAPVPESSTLVLLMIAAAGWCLRQRRAAAQPGRESPV